MNEPEPSTTEPAQQRRPGRNQLMQQWLRILESLGEDRRLQGLLALVGLIVTVLGLVVGYLAYRNDLRANDKTQDVAATQTPAPGPDAPPPSTPASESPPTSTPEITEPTSDPPTPTSPPPSSEGPAREIFKDDFRLHTSEGINLDAGETKIQNGVTITDGDGMDLYVDGYASGHLKAAKLPDSQGPFFKTRIGTLDDCTTLIKRGQDAEYSAVPETTSNLRYCFLTSEGYVAVMRIRGREDRAVPVSVTVWSRVLAQ